MKHRLVDLTIDSIPIGKPLQFVLRGSDGTLLANRGYTIGSRKELENIISRGGELKVDIDESWLVHRAYVLKLTKKLNDDDDIVDISTTKLTYDDINYPKPAIINGFPDWLEYQGRLHTLLKNPQKDNFELRFNYFHTELCGFLDRMPDASLAALVYLSTSEMRKYSAMHAMLVWAVTMMTAKHVLKWDNDTLNSLGKASLSMNISMTELQDKLAMQKDPLTSYQESLVREHPKLSKEMLMELGIKDQLWLDAVLYHREQQPGGLKNKSLSQQMGRLIQRADVFGARLAPRLHRQSLTVTAAMQASYLDEDKNPDEAGSAIVMALGIYAPGSFVQLATNEIAIVTKRIVSRPGVMGKTPKVAVVINREGFPVKHLTERDTSIHTNRIIGAVSSRDVKVSLNLEQLLKLANRHD